MTFIISKQLVLYNVLIKNILFKILTSIQIDLFKQNLITEHFFNPGNKRSKIKQIHSGKFI